MIVSITIDFRWVSLHWFSRYYHMVGKEDSLSKITSTVLSIKKYLHKLNISIHDYNTIFHLLTVYLTPILLIQIKLQNEDYHYK